MNISLIPVPGLENERVEPIPTPERVPNPTDSTGLKYNSSLSVNAFSTLELLVKLKPRGFC